MPYNKNKPYINRVKNNILARIQDDPELLNPIQTTYNSLIEFQKPFLDKFQNLDPAKYNIYESEYYIEPITDFVLDNLLAKRLYEGKFDPYMDESKKNYDAMEILKGFGIDQADLDELYADITSPEIDYEKYTELAQEEDAYEDMLIESDKGEAEIEIEEKARKKEEPKNQKEKEAPKAQPELLQPEKEESDLDSSFNSEASDIVAEVDRVAKANAPKQDGNHPDRRSMTLGMFNACKDIADEYENGEKTQTFAEYMEWKARNIESDAKQTSEDIDSLIESGEEAENIAIFGLDEQGKRKDINLKADAVSEEDYFKAKQNIKENEISQKFGLYYAGKARQDSRRFWDYINPFKWGKMIAENKAIKNLREELKSGYGVSEEQMKTFDQLYSLREKGLPKNFMNVQKDGRIEVATPDGGTLLLPSNGYIQNAMNGSLDIMKPGFEEMDERVIGQQNLEKERLEMLKEVAKDVQEPVSEQLSQPVSQKENPELNINAPKQGDM